MRVTLFGEPHMVHIITHLSTQYHEHVSRRMSASPLILCIAVSFYISYNNSTAETFNFVVTLTFQHLNVTSDYH